jgi:hypothetical protein
MNTFETSLGFYASSAYSLNALWLMIFMSSTDSSSTANGTSFHLLWLDRSVVRTHDEETARLQEVVRDTLIHRLDTPVLTEAFDASHLGPVLPVIELRRLRMRHELHTLGKFTVKSRVMYLLNGAQVGRPGAECVTL